jgi:hypothetical protein
VNGLDLRRGRVWQWSVVSGGLITVSAETTGFPLHRLLRLAGMRWKYSYAPPHGDG